MGISSFEDSKFIHLTPSEEYRDSWMITKNRCPPYEGRSVIQIYQRLGNTDGKRMHERY
jgi:hypothetical protein